MHVSRKTFYLEVEATGDIFALIDVHAVCIGQTI